MGHVMVVTGDGVVFVGFIVGGVAIFLRPRCCMSRAATRGERHGGAASRTGGDMACALGTFGDCRGGGTWRFVLVDAFICAVSEGTGGDR